MYYPPSQPPSPPVPPRRMSGFWRGFLITFAVLGIVGCLASSIGLIVGLRTGRLALPNGLHVPGVQHAPAPDGYLGRPTGAAIFLTFTTPAHDGDNSGLLYAAVREPSFGPGYVETATNAWNGTQSGGKLTIGSWQAVWQSDGSTLLITNYEDTATSHIVALSLVAASTSDYNQAIDALRQT